VHERWVIELLAGLNGGEKTRVYRLLAKLKQHLAAPAPVDRTQLDRAQRVAGEQRNNGRRRN
jgi:hypothetical protein